MYKTWGEVYVAMLARMDACGEAGIYPHGPEADAWYAADEQTVELRRLINIYNKAKSHAFASPNFRSDEDILEFAEAALQEAQYDKEFVQ